MCSSRKTRLICGITVPALSVCLLAGCVKDEESPETQEEPSRDVTELFDPDFARVLESKGYIKDADNITTGEVSAITEVDVSSSELESLRGIEYFTALTNLPCHYNNITSLDVSKNTALKRLDCTGNELTSLNISNNPALRELYCDGNHLTELDVSSTALECMYCNANKLTDLDISGITTFKELKCANNQLKSLNVSNNTALDHLDCVGNQLKSLDVSNNTALTYLNCDDNQLTSLDVSKSTALTELLCQRNLLTGLDITNNTALTSLPCSGNPGESGKFTVTAWFGNDAVPEDFTTGTWSYNGQTVEIEYVKAE